MFTGSGTASSSVASPYGSDVGGLAMTAPPSAPPPYPDPSSSVQPVSLMPYHPSSLPAMPSIPASPHAYVDYYTTTPSAGAVSQSAQSAGAVYLQPVAPNPEFAAGGSTALPGAAAAAAYTGYPCLQYSPLVLSPGVYSVQAPPTGRPTLVGPAHGPAYTMPPPPVVVQQSPIDPPTAAVAALPPAAAANQAPVQLVPVQPQLLCNVARVQPPPQVAGRQMVAGWLMLIYAKLLP